MNTHINPGSPTQRVDKWLWFTRIFRTRTNAKNACLSGAIRINSEVAKPSSPVHISDEVSVRLHGQERKLDVLLLLEKRVGAPIASAAYVDKTPQVIASAKQISSARDGERDQGSGRPTKKDRRRIEQFRRPN